MKQPRNNDFLRFAFRKPDFLTNSRREHCHAQAVFIGIIVIVLKRNHLICEEIGVPRDIGNDVVGDAVNALCGSYRKLLYALRTAVENLVEVGEGVSDILIDNPFGTLIFPDGGLFAACIRRNALNAFPDDIHRLNSALS